jgi:hypothetical protein
MAPKKSQGKRSSSGSDPKSKRIVHGKMKNAMHEFKHHELESGRSGRKVKNPKQAIAIGLSEARRAGANIPRSPSRKKAAAKKKSSGTATKRTAGRKTATKKAAKKSAAKKTTAKKSATKKAAKKAASKRTRR